jgi:hypothetical protein
MTNRDKLRSPDEFDKYIAAEIPDKDKYPVLHDLVCKHMMHGPCGALNDKCTCMQDGECQFRFPQQFCDATQMVKIRIQFIGGMMGKLLRSGIQS